MLRRREGRRGRRRRDGRVLHPSDLIRFCGAKKSEERKVRREKTGAADPEPQPPAQHGDRG